MSSSGSKTAEGGQAATATTIGALLMLLVLAGVLRATAALDYGRGWYTADSFTLINFDEGGSCRAALDAFPYSPWVGWQTLALTELTGHRPPADAHGDARDAKAFCHSEPHLTVARLVSAMTGALTVAVLAALSVVLFPGQHALALTAAALLALSGWHISESMVGTVDAASTFAIYCFLLAVAWAVHGGVWRIALAVALLIPAVATKYWVFAFTAVAVVIPDSVYRAVFGGLSRLRLVAMLIAFALVFALAGTPQLPPMLIYGAPLLFYAVVPWRRLTSSGRLLFAAAPWLAPMALFSDSFVAFTSGGLQGRFGSDYGAIGWHKWLRNSLNMPIVLIVGLGVPAFACLLRGVWVLWHRTTFSRQWLALVPLIAFALYMWLLAPVTYYRHYLPLLPAACLLAAVGLFSLPRVTRAPLSLLLLTWQALLAWDLVSDYRFDPRRELPGWYAQHQPRRVVMSYYVNPPPERSVRHRLFLPRDERSNRAALQQADTLILSENWYDTAFANELNGPLVSDPEKLIKTTAEATHFYRAALAGEHPKLRQSARFSAPRFMPEMLLHYHWYGSFTQFVGDIAVFEVRP